MKNNLSVQLPKEYEMKALAPVVPIETTVPKEKSSKPKIEVVKKADQLPLFYEGPIFKTKKHDFF